MEKSHILLRLSNANVEAIYAVQEKIKTRCSFLTSRIEETFKKEDYVNSDKFLYLFESHPPCFKKTDLLMLEYFKSFKLKLKLSVVVNNHERTILLTPRTDTIQLWGNQMDDFIPASIKIVLIKYTPPYGSKDLKVCDQEITLIVDPEMLLFQREVNGIAEHPCPCHPAVFDKVFQHQPSLGLADVTLSTFRSQECYLHTLSAEDLSQAPLKPLGLDAREQLLNEKPPPPRRFRRNESSSYDPQRSSRAPSICSALPVHPKPGDRILQSRRTLENSPNVENLPEFNFKYSKSRDQPHISDFSLHSGIPHPVFSDTLGGDGMGNMSNIEPVNNVFGKANLTTIDLSNINEQVSDSDNEISVLSQSMPPASSQSRRNESRFHEYNNQHGNRARARNQNQGYYTQQQQRPQSQWNNQHGSREDSRSSHFVGGAEASPAMAPRTAQVPNSRSGPRDSAFTQQSSHGVKRGNGRFFASTPVARGGFSHNAPPMAAEHQHQADSRHRDSVQETPQGRDTVLPRYNELDRGQDDGHGSRRRGDALQDGLPGQHGVQPAVQENRDTQGADQRGSLRSAVSGQAGAPVSRFSSKTKSTKGAVRNNKKSKDIQGLDPRNFPPMTFPLVKQLQDQPPINPLEVDWENQFTEAGIPRHLVGDNPGYESHFENQWKFLIYEVLLDEYVPDRNELAYYISNYRQLNPSRLADAERLWKTVTCCSHFLTCLMRPEPVAETTFEEMREMVLYQNRILSNIQTELQRNKYGPPSPKRQGLPVFNLHLFNAARMMKNCNNFAIKLVANEMKLPDDDWDTLEWFLKRLKIVELHKTMMQWKTIQDIPEEVKQGARADAYVKNPESIFMGPSDRMVTEEERSLLRARYATEGHFDPHQASSWSDKEVLSFLKSRRDFAETATKDEAKKAFKDIIAKDGLTKATEEAVFYTQAIVRIIQRFPEIPKEVQTEKEVANALNAGREVKVQAGATTEQLVDNLSKTNISGVFVVRNEDTNNNTEASQVFAVNDGASTSQDNIEVNTTPPSQIAASNLVAAAQTPNNDTAASTLEHIEIYDLLSNTEIGMDFNPVEFPSPDIYLNLLEDPMMTEAAALSPSQEQSLQTPTN